MSSAHSQIVTKPYKLRSDFELVQKVEFEWRAAFNAYKSQFERCERNWKAYSGKDGGAWDDKDLDRLNKEDRIATVFNITRPKVDAFTGSQLADLWDFDWVPIEGPRNALTEKVKDSYYIDKEMMNYDYHISETLLDGNVFAGEIKMEMTSPHEGLPRIKFCHKQQPFVLRDPYWISRDDSDCESLWDVYHLSPVQLYNIFHPKGQIVRDALRRYKLMGGDWRDEEQIFDQAARELKGHMLRVIEHHWLEIQHTTRAVGRQLGNYRLIPFPLTEDKAKLRAFKEANNIDPLSIFEMPIRRRVHKVTTVCPSLLRDALLENGYSNVQCGRLPYFQYSPARIGGRNLGIVDYIYDVQQTIDKREAKLTDLIETSQGGGKMVNADAFRDPEDVRRFQKDGNDPSAIFMMNGEEMRTSRLIEYVNSNQYPAQIVNQLERMYSLADRVSSVPLAMESMTQSASEPAALYDRKLQVLRIATMLITKRVQKFMSDMAEAYLLQWQRAYTGVRREYTSRDGKRQVILNNRVVKDGKIMVENVPMLAPRCSVFVTESEQSLNRMTSNRILYEALINKVAQSHPELATLMIHAYLRTMPMDDKMKSKMEWVERLQTVRDLSKIKSDIAQLDAATAQSVYQMLEASGGIEALQQQMQNPQQAPEAQVEALPEEEYRSRLSPQEQGA